jgi:hypothetical protein
MASFGFQDLGSKDKQVAKGNDGKTLCMEYWRSGITEAGLHGEQALDFIIGVDSPPEIRHPNIRQLFGDVSN